MKQADKPPKEPFDLVGDFIKRGPAKKPFDGARSKAFEERFPLQATALAALFLGWPARDEDGKLIQGAHGEPVTRHLRPGGGEERSALKLLAHLIRTNELPEFFLVQLSILFDPDTRIGRGMEAWDRVFARRRKQPARGPRNTLRLTIGLYVADAYRDSGQLESAFALAIEKFGTSRSTIARAWSEFKKSKSFSYVMSRDRTPLMSK